MKLKTKRNRSGNAIISTNFKQKKLNSESIDNRLNTLGFLLSVTNSDLKLKVDHFWNEKFYIIFYTLLLKQLRTLIFMYSCLVHVYIE